MLSALSHKVRNLQISCIIINSVVLLKQSLAQASESDTDLWLDAFCFPPASVKFVSHLWCPNYLGGQGIGDGQGGLSGDVLLLLLLFFVFFLKLNVCAVAVDGLIFVCVANT